jgi:hypothetical protein
MESYLQDLAKRLSTIHEVAQLLVQEQRTYHQELVNLRRPGPRTYSVGNVLFARGAVRSDAAKGPINKLQYAFTGPWRITAILKATLYKLQHCSTPHQKDNRHASDLSPYPLEPIPFEPVKGSDNRYGQLHKPIKASPFKEAGINGFKPISPFKVMSNYLTTDSALAFHWPSLSELSDDIAPFPWSTEEERRLYLSGDTVTTLPVMYMGPPLASPSYSLPAIPKLNTLVCSINQSSDHLFFISHSIGPNEARKWRLVQVAFKQSMSSYSLCLQDGCFLLEFFICHPSNLHVNAINQCY